MKRASTKFNLDKEKTNLYKTQETIKITKSLKCQTTTQLSAAPLIKAAAIQQSTISTIRLHHRTYNQAIRKASTFFSWKTKFMKRGRTICKRTIQGYHKTDHLCPKSQYRNQEPNKGEGSTHASHLSRSTALDSVSSFVPRRTWRKSLYKTYQNPSNMIISSIWNPIGLL